MLIDLSNLIWSHLYCVFLHIYSLLIQKNFRECRNVSAKFPCALFLCILSGDFFIFSERFSPFYSCFCVISTWFRRDSYNELLTVIDMHCNAADQLKFKRNIRLSVLKFVSLLGIHTKIVWGSLSSIVRVPSQHLNETCPTLFFILPQI